MSDDSGGELLTPPAEAPRAAEPAEREAKESLPTAAAGDAEALEAPVEAPAGDGGEIESGLAGVLYVRKTKYNYCQIQVGLPQAADLAGPQTAVQHEWATSEPDGRC